MLCITWHKRAVYDLNRVTGDFGFNREKATRLMEDSKYFFSFPETQEAFQRLRKIFRYFVEIRKKGDPRILETELRRFLDNASDKISAEAVVRDVVDSFTVNFNFPLSLSRIGLKTPARPIIRSWATPIYPGDQLRTDQGRDLEVVSEEVDESSKDYHRYHVIELS